MLVQPHEPGTLTEKCAKLAQSLGLSGMKKFPSPLMTANGHQSEVVCCEDEALENALDRNAGAGSNIFE